MLYPVENAILVSKKAERCDFLIKEKDIRAEREINHEQSVCLQKLKISDEAATLKVEAVKEHSTPPWMIAVAYAAGAATVVLGAWVAGQVAR